MHDATLKNMFYCFVLTLGLDEFVINEGGHFDFRSHRFIVNITDGQRAKTVLHKKVKISTLTEM